jgi:nitrogen fixation protein FixH
MRVRFFFWLLFVLTCVSVLTFAFLFQRDVPALIQLSLDQQAPKAQQVVTLSLHLTDSEGIPIDNASIISHANMTTMHMQDDKHQLKSVGQGKYIAHLQFSMAGSWLITTSVHANGIVPTQQKLFVMAT